MAIRHLVWACVACGREGTLELSKNGEVCSHCGTTYSRERGARIAVRRREGETQVYTPTELVAMLPEISPTGSARCEIREWVRDRPLHISGHYLGRYEELSAPRSGTITVDATCLTFAADSGDSFSIPLLDITAIQPSSGTLQIKARRRPVFSLRFETSSPKLWEERLQAALSGAYQHAGLGEIAEYQPRVAPRHRKVGGRGAVRIRRRIQAARQLAPKRPWQYRLASWIARNVWRYLGGGLRVEGLENVPAAGPFIVLVNHESYLETMLVPAVMSRAAFMMAKSTQFGSRLTGWVMSRLHTYPVRRFAIDPHAVRYTVSRLSEGYGIVIFIEGERTWDGTLQPARLGTVRLALAAGVPVIPCHVEGAYSAWPRWSSRTQRNPITIIYGRPLELPQIRTRQDCEAQLDASVSLIRRAIGPRPGQPARS